MDWNEYFFKICHAVKERSKDQNTKIGCVIVADDNTVVSTGYNGFPSGVDDSFWPNNRTDVLHVVNCGKDNLIVKEVPEPFTVDGIKREFTKIGTISKYDVFVHAETNAIYSAAKNGHPTRGCTMYCNYLPCNGCAMAIINAGIKRVVIETDEMPSPAWAKAYTITWEMFSQAGIEVVVWNKSEEK